MGAPHFREREHTMQTSTQPQQVTIALTPETIRYLDHCTSRGKFGSRSKTLESILPRALEDWEDRKDAATNALEADPRTATWTT